MNKIIPLMGLLLTCSLSVVAQSISPQIIWVTSDPVSCAANKQYNNRTTGDIFIRLGSSGSLCTKINGGGGSSSLTVGTTTITDGTDTRVFFQDGVVLGQDAGLTYNKITDILTVAGGLTVTGSSNAGDLELTEGTAPATLTANTFQLYAPVDVAAGGLAYVLPGAASTGAVIATNSAGIMTLSHVAPGTSGNVLTSNGTTWTSAAAATSVTPNSTVGVVPYLSATSVYSDSPLLRIDADTMELRRAANAQSLIVNATYTSGSNYRRLNLASNGIFFQAAGASDDSSDIYVRNTTSGGIQLGAGNGNRWTIYGPVSGNDGALFPAGTFSFGLSSNPIGPAFISAYRTGTNCADSAGAAACGSAAAGSVVIDAASTSVVVSTSAVTANSQIFVQFDSSLGTRLGITCNATPATPAVTARTAGTSFTITIPVAPVSTPACYSFWAIN